MVTRLFRADHANKCGASHRHGTPMATTCHFKLVLLGDTAVGKSCLVVRFVRDEFFEFQEPTIGGGKALAPTAAASSGRSQASPVPQPPFSPRP